MIGKKVTEKAKVKVSTKKVQFELPAMEARQVYLTGDFNNWEKESLPMKKDKNGLWKKTLSLKPGRYEYRFLIDGIWGNDPACAGCVPNEFGTCNCVKMVE